MNRTRREAAALLGLGVVASRVEAAQHALHQMRSSPGEYRPQFFNPEDYHVVEELAEMIIPADDVSPGAREARVAACIDLVVANSSAAAQKQWRSGLAAWEALAQAHAGRRFAELDRAQRAEMLNSAERAAGTDAGRLFGELKHMTVFAYYTSEIGLRKDLGYQGNAVLASFPGCPHSPGHHR